MDGLTFENWLGSHGCGKGEPLIGVSSSGFDRGGGFGFDFVSKNAYACGYSGTGNEYGFEGATGRGFGSFFGDGEGDGSGQGFGSGGGPGPGTGYEDGSGRGQYRSYAPVSPNAESDVHLVIGTSGNLSLHLRFNVASGGGRGHGDSVGADDCTGDCSSRSYWYSDEEGEDGAKYAPRGDGYKILKHKGIR